MTVSVPLSERLINLTGSLTSANSCFPSSPEGLLPPDNGISLLDTKNDLLLSYLEHLVFLILVNLRRDLGEGKSDIKEPDSASKALQKLIELRVHLEKGVRPLQSRLSYQIEKMLRSADDAERSSLRRSEKLRTRDEEVASAQNDSDRDSSDSEAESTHADSEDKSNSQKPTAQLDDLAYRPNPSDLLRAQGSHLKSSSSGRVGASGRVAYRPPRITPTAAPDHQSIANSRSERRERKSHILDEYINTELSSAPTSQPSIGSNSTILNRGRSALSLRDREKEKEKVDYEERNFSRLPKASKAESKKNKARSADARNGRFGGEDWTGLGEVGDRVARSVAFAGGDRSNREGVLERREKRKREGRDFGDEGRGLRGEIGESFQKRKNTLEGRARKRQNAIL